MKPNALIVKVKIKKLGQSEKDAELTAEIHRTHGLSPEAGSYTKAIYPPGVFHEITSVEGKVRTWHKSQQGKRLILSSLGWICPAPHVEMYVEAMEKLEAEFYPAVDRVVSNWDFILAQCREIQGPRFEPDNYPPPDRVRGFFQFLRSMTPLPRPQDIADLDFLCQQRIDAIHDQMRNDVAAALQDGARQAMSRVFSQVQHIAEQLGKPDPTITDKLVDNLRELLELAPQLNLGGDPVIGELVRDCRQKLLVAPDTLRESTLQRRKVALAARGIASSFGSLGGRKLAA